VVPAVRVLLISFSTLPSLQKYLYTAFDELNNCGIDVWSVGSATLRVPRRLSDHNVVVDTPANPKPSIGSLWSSKRSLGAVASMVEKLRPDVVHFVNKHTWNYLLLQRLQPRARRHRPVSKWVHTFHDPIGHDGDSVRRGVIMYHRLVQRHLDAVIVHSKVAQTQTLQVLRPECPVVRVPLGEKRWKDYEGIDDSVGKTVLVFGRLNRYKGCELYPEIFREVYRLDPEVQIRVAGQPSKDLPAGLLNRIAACPNVALDSRFIEESEIDGYFRGASLVLTPYTSVTQSGVILDAFRNSRSVLAFKIDGMIDLLPAGARVVDAFDTRAYARLLVELVNDPTACAEAGRDAWQFGKEQFAPAAMAAGFARTYESITRGATQNNADTPGEP
jgi:glycosyltransferase involved in cell wall biosynthesis